MPWVCTPKRSWPWLLPSPGIGVATKGIGRRVRHAHRWARRHATGVTITCVWVGAGVALPEVLPSGSLWRLWQALWPGTAGAADIIGGSGTPGITDVPEPSSVAVFLVGVAATLALRRRR